MSDIGLLADWQIKDLAKKGMIYPFQPFQIRKVLERNVISMGLSSYGYDIRLSPKEFRVFRHIPGTVVDPKRFNPANLELAPLHEVDGDRFFILPAHTYGLGVAVELLDVPSDVTVISVGKSTYARVGIVANVTPAEAGWRGHLTLEFSNSSDADVRLYADEGVLQLLFLRGQPCDTSYDDRKGKYQDQGESVVLARV